MSDATSAPTLFDAPTENLRNFETCDKSQTVHASHLGALRTVILTESGAELICANGTLVLSVQQYLEFVKYRKSA